MLVEFHAQEYHADGSLQPARYSLEGATSSGWTVSRNGEPSLTLGPGYSLLRTRLCGVCSTDLARRHLPFPLPQITGHEVIAVDEAGRRFAVEINASPIARGIASDCPFCRLAPNHCPDRLVLGIHDLPGGFGPYVLAPIRALHAVPDRIGDDAAVLIEPLAAALHAVETIQPSDGQRIAVLGPRKLGMLVIAALAAWRRRHGRQYQIVAVARRDDLLTIARDMGADEAVAVRGDEPNPPICDVVVDCTGSPEGLEFAIRAASREVHLKSTHGRRAAGLDHLTELVVDELSVMRFDEANPPTPLDRDRPVVAWVAGPPSTQLAAADLRIATSAAQHFDSLEAAPPARGLPRFDAAVADSIEAIESCIRPFRDRQASLVRPGGAILLTRPRGEDLAKSPLVRAVWERGLRLTSSRCGDFAAAIALLKSDARLRGVAPRLITHRFPAHQLSRAFEAAAGRNSIKAIVEHEMHP